MRKTILLCFCIIFICMVCLGACSKGVDLGTAEKKNIALILKMHTGHYWGTVKLGADTAAGEFNVNIDYSAPDDEEDIEGQIKLVNQALDRKVDALILAASDYKKLVKVTERAYEQRIPVIIIDSEVDTKKINSYIAADNIDAGKKAGHALVNLAGEECRVAVMSFVKGTRNAEQREEGLMSVISQYPGIKVVAKEYCLSDTKLAYSLTKKIIAENKGVDVFVALNSIASEGVAQAIDEVGSDKKIKVIGFDSTLQEIDFLEKGVIQALIIQSPFSMGYLGVKHAVEAMEGKKIPERTDTSSWVINTDNMYLPENQKLVFPFIK